MTWLWVGFFSIVGALLALDLGVFHRRDHEMRFREAVGWTFFWIGISLLFNVLVYFFYQHRWLGAVLPHLNHHVGDASWIGDGTNRPGLEAAFRFFTGYLLEKALSVDNIFVMAVLFRKFRVEPQYQHRVLFWGILGAIVSRGAMIFVGVWLVTRFSWLFYVFGAYLAFAGMKMLLSGQEDRTFDPEQGFLMRQLSKMVRIKRGEHNGHFITRVDGKLAFTRLAVALIVIELTDVLFALDSVPAVLAITTDAFIVMTSNIFAILGLRALYFVLASMIAQFHYLQVALALVLVVIGSKMFLHTVYDISTSLSLIVIGGILAAGIIASAITSRAGDKSSPFNDDP